MKKSTVCLTNINAADLATFQREGFLVVDKIVTLEAVEMARERCQAVFYGDFETGIEPDKWKWRGGRDSAEMPRAMNNVWKSDSSYARIVLDWKLGKACADLMGWPGVRLEQDFLIWKVPNVPGCEVAFHQDNSYQDWVVPPEIISCWISLDQTTIEGGTLEYVRGSHHWGLSGRVAQFHGPSDMKCDLEDAARREGYEGDFEYVPILVPPGGGVFHNGYIWHGSKENNASVPRRSITAHMIHSAAHFHSKVVSPVFNHYKLHGDDAMHESFFPVVWDSTGYRSELIDQIIS